MRTLLAVLFTAAVAAGCASYIGEFEKAGSVSEYCNGAGSHAKVVFASDYRDKKGLIKKDAENIVKSEMRTMATNAQKEHSLPEELNNVLKAIKKEEVAQLEALRITYEEPYRSPEAVRLRVRGSCLENWGGGIWYNLHEFES